MNTKNLKAYAPKARREFIEAVKNRAAKYGIYQDSIAEVTFEGDTAIIEDRVYSRKVGSQRLGLEHKVKAVGYDLFVREMAYTWFNRLAAIRYMELHDYLGHGFRVLSHPDGPGRAPEILSYGADVATLLDLDKAHIVELQLAGDKEEQLYRELLLGQCHYLYKVMPFLFEPIDDATELLLPDNLTKTDSLLVGLINDIPEEDWQEIEVIGWLYQFYISEHKDAVIGKVVKSEDIPAATQLFTPNWIVKYLVQNSLGRQWLATYPDAGLKGKMEYYIEPAEQTDAVINQLKAITPTSLDPEQIKVLDPAAGSGHILVEVYEVLKEIYLERGYRLREIPQLILSKNIYGLDIDDRAAQLAGFALMMKAREDDRRIFGRVENGDVSLNVFSVQSTEGMETKNLWEKLNLAGQIDENEPADLFAENAQYDPLDDNELGQHYVMLDVLVEAFKAAKTLGSLIDIKRFMQDKHDQMLKAIKKLEADSRKLEKQLQKSVEGSKSAEDLEKQIAALEADIYKQTQIALHYKRVLDNHLLLIAELDETLNRVALDGDFVAKQVALALLPIIDQTKTLTQLYDVVVANPPYMGNKGMNSALKVFAKAQFPNSKSDLFAIFMERAFALLTDTGYNAQVNMQSWMFLSSYEKLREWLLDTKTIITMAHLGARAFGQISGEVVQTTAWVLSKAHLAAYKPVFFRLIKGNEEEKKQALISKQDLYSSAKQIEFKDIPGSPIAYWVGKSTRDSFRLNKKFGELATTRKGLVTARNDIYVRAWCEVSNAKLGLNFNDRCEAKKSGCKWFPYIKGGEFRRWYGNKWEVVNWEGDGYLLQNTFHPTENRVWATNFNLDYIFKPNLNWSDITGGGFAARYSFGGEIFDATGLSCFPEEEDMFEVLGYLNSSIAGEFLRILNPTLHFQAGNIASLPYLPAGDRENLREIVAELINIEKQDWDEFETSWDFVSNPIVRLNDRLILKSVEHLSEEYRCISKNVANLEFAVDDIITSLFGLEVVDTKRGVQSVTLKTNRLFRYKSNYQSEELSNMVMELVSYTLGTMMGRYSLDREGLVYAHSGNKGFKELVAEGAYKTFPADDDGIVPLACEEWFFDDDATTRFREFVKVVWGEEHLQENIEFVAESLCLHAIKPKAGEGAIATIRRYFATQFFKDHCKTYKNRPIYWLFSSGTEKAFECLVYLHRYNEATLARMRTEYVTPLMGKYTAQLDLLAKEKEAASGAELRKIEKQMTGLEKKQTELRNFDEQLKHYADRRISLDLDDGVKVNYGKFGTLLSNAKAIHGQQPEISLP